MSLSSACSRVSKVTMLLDADEREAVEESEVYIPTTAGS